MQDNNWKYFIISLGSNLDPDLAEQNLNKAEVFLSELLGADVKFSSHYTTDGVGSGAGKQYLNSVCTGKTSLVYLQIKNSLKQFELECGRTLECKLSGIVPIDLDLLQLGDVIYKEKDLSMNYVTKGLKEIK